jgi:DNA-binding transcriptional ArsR family regulator
MSDADRGGRKGRKSAKKKGTIGEKARKARDSRRRGKTGGRRRVSPIVAIAHPLRRRILHLIAEWGEPISPAQVAIELDLPLGTAIYHANVLRRLGAVEPVGVRRVHGTVEHVYDSTIEDDPPTETPLDETEDMDEEGK